MMSSFRGGEVSFLMTRLERAAQRAHDHWIPSNPVLTSRIRGGLKTGEYNSDLEGLIRELKTDFALFMLCVRESLAMLRTEGKPIPRSANPLQILRIAGVKRLAQILERSGQRISTHTLAQASEPQQLRLKEAMISASTAELLASSKAITPEIGFSVALLRQLGLALIAWNYPTVYQRALERSDETVSLEHAIDEMLGFSPTLFGSYLLARWGVSDEMRAIVGEDPGAHEVRPLNESQTFLRKICEVGEALARAENPEHYPRAEEDWEMARQAIRSSLGFDGLQIVQARVRENCGNYRGLLKEIFADTALLNPGQRIAAFKDRRALDRNPYIKKCQPSLRHALHELYARMDSRSICQHTVRVLARELFQLGGFVGGCVYVLDPAVRQFVPRLTIGKVALRQISTVSYSRYSAENDPVIRAFDCQAPLVNHGQTDSTQELASITAALGSGQKIGVLYLEVPQVALNAFDRSIMTHFKALRRALEDALRLS